VGVIPAILGPEIGELVVVADHEASRGFSTPRAVPRREAALPLASPTVQYALSVFEGLKAFRDPNGGLHTFRATAHAQRLRRSAERLCLPDVPESLFLRACALAVLNNVELVPPHGRGSLYLRPTLVGSEEYLGVRTARTHQLSVVVTTGAQLVLRTLRLRAEPDYIRAAPGGCGAAKTGANYGGALLAQKRAHADGFDDVLWLDALYHRDVGEAGTMNIFFVFRDSVVTPSLDGTILAGITRDSVLTLLREMKRDVVERTIALDEIAQRARASELLEIFGTSTALRLVRIGEIGIPGGSIRPTGGDLADRLFQQLGDLQEGRTPDSHGWREPIETAVLSAAGGR
jgi:branched-chain amino acid aminotransferase